MSNLTVTVIDGNNLNLIVDGASANLAATKSAIATAAANAANASATASATSATASATSAASSASSASSAGTSASSAGASATSAATSASQAATSASQAAAIVVGDLVSTITVDTTNLEVTNIKAKDGTAAMSIADVTGTVAISSGLGIGTSAPSQKLEVAGNIFMSGAGTASRYLALHETSTYAGDLVVQAGGGSSGFGGAITMYGHSHATYPGTVIITKSSGASGPAFIVGNGYGLNNPEYMRIDTSGNLLVGSTSAISGGGVLQLSSGITFPATQVASANANTLDDYEEGTWTPTQGAGLTVVGIFSSGGLYTKIGRLVTVTGYVAGSTSVTASANQIICGNLPFSATIGADSEIGAITTSSLSQVGAVMVYGSVIYSSTMVATQTLQFTITYRV